MAKGKIFTIQIDGIDKACEEVDKLSNKLETLDKQVSQSKMTLLISNAFGNATQVVEGFGNRIETLSAAIEGLKPLTETLESLQKLKEKAVEKSIEQEEKQIEKRVNKEKKTLETIKALTIEQQASQSAEVLSIKAREIDKALRLKYIEAQTKQKLELDAQIQKYGDETKYTQKAYQFYKEYYASLESIYKEDTINLKKTLAEKEAYEKAYTEKKNELNEKAQELANKDNKVVSGNSYPSGSLLQEFKYLSDLKKEAHITDIIELKRYLKEEETLMTDRKTRIDGLAASVVEKRTEGAFKEYNRIKETRQNYQKLKELSEQHIESLRNERDQTASHYDAISGFFEENSMGWITIQEEKQKKLYEIDQKIIGSQKTVKDAYAGTLEAVAENIKKLHTEFEKYYTSLSTLANDFLAEQLKHIDDRKKEVDKALSETTAAYEKHKSKVEELEQNAANASGGRATIIQEQLAREMEVRDELHTQQKEQQKEKEELDKLKIRKEKQQHKLTKIQEIAQATANQSAAVIKAWGMGPIIGPIMAAITLAATGIQIAKMKREWDKLEDGGLLRGKRHAQGGMRIEGTNIEVEGDEFVVNRESTRKNLGLINYINRNRKELSPTDINSYFTNSGQTSSGNLLPTRRMYEDGGKLTNLEVIDSITAPTDDKILDAIARINFRPVVSVVDISNAQNRVTQIKDIAGA